MHHEATCGLAAGQYVAEAWRTLGYTFSLFRDDHATVEDGDGRDRFDWDMTIHGPIAGLKITF